MHYFTSLDSILRHYVLFQVTRYRTIWNSDKLQRKETVGIKNFTHIEITSRVILGNAGHQSVRNALSPRGFSKILNMKNVKKNVINNFNVQWSVHRKYILIYIQQDATLHSLYISGNCSTCFGWYPYPSSGAHTIVSTATGTCQTLMHSLIFVVPCIMIL